MPRPPAQDISFLTNRAAVLFEQGKYDECIKVRVSARDYLLQIAAHYDASRHGQDCDDAIEKGHETRADFKARVAARFRACCMKDA